MRSVKKLKTSLALLLMISFSTAIASPPGRYVYLERGQMIPWAGWCFDRDASAQILADKQFQEKQCRLKIDRALQMQLAKNDLELGKLRADMIYEVSTRDTTIEALKKENLKLEEIVIENSNSDWHLFASLGFVAGSLLTITIVELAK